MFVKHPIFSISVDYIRIVSLCILIITAMGGIAPVFCAEYPQWGPWDEKKPLEKKKDEHTGLLDGNILKMALSVGVKFFQRFISPVDGDRCSMYPTCSAYGLKAIRKHGAAIGFVMTADRLIHEAGEQKFAPIIKKYGRYRYLDPIYENDFWWYKKR